LSILRTLYQFLTTVGATGKRKCGRNSWHGHGISASQANTKSKVNQLEEAQYSFKLNIKIFDMKILINLFGFY
jgi:hypothetical protein